MTPQKICFLIDDDQDDQEIFNIALQQVEVPLTCVVASDCAEAIRRLSIENSFSPDYIFLDLNMPRMNGKECLKEIKKQAHLKHIPVIMYSTSLKTSDIEETKKLGAIEFITKPANVNTLAHVLNSFFKSNNISNNISMVK